MQTPNIQGTDVRLNAEHEGKEVTNLLNHVDIFYGWPLISLADSLKDEEAVNFNNSILGLAMILYLCLFVKHVLSYNWKTDFNQSGMYVS